MNETKSAGPGLRNMPMRALLQDEVDAGSAVGGARVRQTLVMNAATNEALPRKGIERRTYIGDAPALPAPSTDDKE